MQRAAINVLDNVFTSDIFTRLEILRKDPFGQDKKVNKMDVSLL